MRPRGSVLNSSRNSRSNNYIINPKSSQLKETNAVELGEVRWLSGSGIRQTTSILCPRLCPDDCKHVHSKLMSRVIVQVQRCDDHIQELAHYLSMRYTARK